MIQSPHLLALKNVTFICQLYLSIKCKISLRPLPPNRTCPRNKHLIIWFQLNSFPNNEPSRACWNSAVWIPICVNFLGILFIVYLFLLWCTVCQTKTSLCNDNIHPAHFDEISFSTCHHFHSTCDCSTILPSPSLTLPMANPCTDISRLEVKSFTLTLDWRGHCEPGQHQVP